MGESVIDTRRIVLASMAIFLIGCQKPPTAPPPEPPKVTIALPVQKDVTIFREFTGRTAAFERAELRARVTGFLKSVEFKESSDVAKDSLLFVIEQEPFQAALNGAKAELQSRNAAFQLSQANVARAKHLIKSKAIGQQELDVIAAEYAQAQAAIAVANAAIEEAQLQFDYTEVKSPIDGRIDRWQVDVGNLVGSGESTLLATVVRLDPIHVYFDIDEQKYLEILESHGGIREARPEEKPTVFLARQIDKDFPFEGRLDFIDNEIDPNTGTILARGTFANPDYKISPGMFARLRVPGKVQPNAVLVEEAAIGTDMQGKYVLLVDEKNIVHRRTIDLGALENNLRVVLSGLKADEKYITRGLQRARPGLPVRPEMGGEGTVQE